MKGYNIKRLPVRLLGAVKNLGLQGPLTAFVVQAFEYDFRAVQGGGTK